MDGTRQPIRGFAHRGARAHAPENTLEGFVLATRMGATAVETDVWLSADRRVVIDHDGVVRRDRVRIPIAALDRIDLPAHLPTLDALFAAVGTGVEVSIDVKDAAGARATVEVCRRALGDDLGSIWLCHPDLDVLDELRAASSTVRIVASLKRRRVRHDPRCDPHALAERGVDVLNLRGDTWTRGLVRAAHDAGLAAFAWNVQFGPQMRILARWGIDGLYSDHTDRLVAFLADWHAVEELRSPRPDRAARS